MKTAWTEVVAQVGPKTLAGVAAQVADWRKRTEKLPEHTTQVERLADAIDQLRAQVPTQLLDPTDPEPDPLALALLRRAGAHATALIWDFYASRLAQRHVDTLQPTLVLADDLAYTCWATVVTASTRPGRDLRAPPLTYFANTPTPLVYPRRLPYDVKLPKPWDSFFDDAVRSLPVPVIGLPVSQSQFLPGLVAVAHEVGHVLEDDLRETAALDALAKDKVPAAWAGWRYELAADVWGLLGCGAPYLAALMSALLDNLDATDAHYPPAATRLAVLFAVAAREGFGLAKDPGVAQVRKVWEALVPPAPLDADVVSAMVDVLLAPWESLGKKPPHAILAPLRTSDFVVKATRALDGHADADPRVFCAAAAWGWFTNPTGYGARADQTLLAAYRGLRGSGPRAGRTRGGLDPKTLEVAGQAGDRDRVDQLLVRLAERLTEPLP